MQQGGGMRQVFAVGGARSAPVEYSGRSSCARKRERNGGERDMPKGNGRRNPYPWDDEDFWEDEKDVEYVRDGNRCVSWSKNGSLTIRARNDPFPPEGLAGKGCDIRPRDPFGECDGFRKRMQTRDRDGYGPWDMQEGVGYHEYEEDYPPFRGESLLGGYQRQEEYRYRDMDAMDAMDESPPSPRSTGPVSNGYRRSRSHDRAYESRGYAHRSPSPKDHMRQSRGMRRLSPSPRRMDRFEREHSWERYPRRLSPPPRLERERPRHAERGHSRRLTPPPVRTQRREEANYNAWEDNSRKERENGYLHSPERRSGDRLKGDKDDDLPPGFGFRSKASSPPRPVDVDARGDPRTCYRCRKPGHLSAQCPMKAERAERSPKRPRVVDEAAGKTCYTCGKIGHFSFQCPSRPSEKVPVDSSASRRNGKQCYSCGEHGHVSYACPSNSSGKDSGLLRTLRRCYNCYEVGHLVHECPMFADSDILRKETQDSEDEAIMYKTKLTSAEKTQYLRENRCFTCGKTGHPYYSCPQSEKRLEYVFNDREAKSSWKLLKNPCWKYKDDSGGVHGPVSLSCLATRLEDGIVHGDVEVHHMYSGSLPPTSVSKLVRISQSSSLVSIIGCMPEAASFLGEEMDAESCKANALAALQTKLHYDIFETTIRWILISSMNEALQNYKTARKHWGKNRPPSAEDYSDPDRGGPPHSSDCDLSSPDGITEQQTFHAMMLEECEKYVAATKTEDNASNVLAAVQACIHSGVLEAARNTILDAIIAICLDNWMQSKETPAIADLQLESIPMPQLEGIQIPEVIFEEHSEDSKGTNESSPAQDKQSASPTQLKKWSQASKDEKLSPAPAESKLSPPPVEDNNPLDQERTTHPDPIGDKLPEERPRKQQPTEQPRSLRVDLGHFLTCPPRKQQAEIKSQCMETKKQVVEGKKPTKLRIVTRRQALETKKQSQEVKRQALEPRKQKTEAKKKTTETKTQAKTGTPETPKPTAESKSEPLGTRKRTLENRKPATEAPKESIDSDMQPSESKKQKTETIKPILVTEKTDAGSGTVKTDDAPPQLVLKVFRKAKKNDAAATDVSPAACVKETQKQARKRVLKLCDLADTADVVLDDQNVEQRLVDKCVDVGDKLSEHSDAATVPESTVYTGHETTDSVDVDADRSACPRSAGCARCTISGWEWREWSKNFKVSSQDNVAGDECNKRSVSLLVKPARSTRRTRALARHDGLGNVKSRKKLLRLQRSKIHTWGVVTVEPIEAEEFVAEYVGELVRPKVADARESRYARQGLGNSYFFRVGDGYVIDATLRGGLARFINHSCDPNCYTKIITVEGQKRVFIYARKQISPGTEITYDYKFPREEQKILCLCRSPRYVNHVLKVRQITKKAIADVGGF